MLAVAISVGCMQAIAGAVVPPLQLSLSKDLDPGRPALAWSSEQRRSNAVALARSGRLQSGANILAALHRQAPGDTAILNDLISVRNWQGAHARVLELAEQLDPSTTPAFTLSAVAASARKSGSFAMAAQWYEHALAQSPADARLRAGLVLAQADAGTMAAARENFELLPPEYRHSIAGQLVDAYVLRAAGQYPPALLRYSAVLQEDPDNHEALHGKFLTLGALLLPQQALELARQHPGIASSFELESLYADRAALWVRWGLQSRALGKQRFADLDRALDLLATNLARFEPGSALGRITRFDYIVALHARGRHQEAIGAYRALGMDDDVLPVYVQRAVAGALLAIRQPEAALRLYDMALIASPDDFDLQKERFYALIELERHQQARAVAAELVFSQDIWRSVPGSRIVKPNPRRLQAEIVRALSLAYADQLQAAEIEFADLLAEAPHNTDVRQELANVYRWRGWPRRALYEYRQVMAVEPELLSARVGLANTLLDLHMGSQLERQLDSLQSEYGDDSGVQRLVRRHELYHRHEIVAEAGAGESSGEQFGSRQHSADLRAYLGGRGYHWRPFIAVHDARAEFSEGIATRRRGGVGLQYRRPGHTATLALTAGLRGESRPGLALEYGFEPSDHWSVGALLETESHAMPLRGYRIGIDAARLRLSTRYRFNELAQAGAALDLMDFSDGNFRTAWLLDARRRVLNGIRWKVDLTGSIYASTNDLSAVAYYSPESDRAVGLGLDTRWRMFRRYERNFEHQLLLNAGRYRQRGFAAGSIGSIEYRHNFQFSEALAFYLGIRRARALYDGNFEYGTFFLGGFRGRF